MASISSLMSSSSSSSIYGNRTNNIISGLASGLDTESMIEGLVQSYQQKISGLQQDRTKLQWQQEAYQSISDKLVEFSRKYTSYTSSTNLLSSSFFTKAVLTSTAGKYADLVTASGKSSSDVVLNGVAQLATAARYTNSAAGLSGTNVDGSGKITVAGEKLDLTGNQTVSTMSGSLTFTYGTKDVTIEFGELDLYNKDDGTLDTEAFQKAIEEKLGEQTINLDGEQVKASERIGVSVSSDGKVTLTDKKNAGNDVVISGATGDLKGMITDADTAIEDEASTFTMDTSSQVIKEFPKTEYVAGKTMTFTLDGKTKTFTLPDKIDSVDSLKDTIQEELNKAFGSGKVGVDLKDGALAFTVNQGSTLSVTSAAGEALGLGDSGLTSYLNTSKTLGELGTIGEGTDGAETLTINGMTLTGKLMKVDKDKIIKQEDGTYLDTDGNKVDENGNRLGKDGELLYSYDLTINGKTLSFNRDTAMETVINSINSDTEMGVNVSYSKTTNQFVFTAKETGEGGRIEMNRMTEVDGEKRDNLAAALFGEVKPDSAPSSYTAGQDAVVSVSVNGSDMVLTRSSNTFDIDGMSITVNGTFNSTYDPNAPEGGTSGTDTKPQGPLTSEKLNQILSKPDGQNTIFDPNGEAVTFTTKTDTDTIVDAIKQMVEDYNEIVTEVKKAYSDMPLQQTSGSRYEPLTDEDKADMSESEIEAYEEKAKTGILFMDQDLSSLYNALRSAVTPGGTDGSLLRSIGIETSYSEGLTTISLDEEALRQALDTNPDQVKDVFTKSKENGASTNGLMTSIYQVTERYAATTGAVKGILIEKAGSKYSPTAALDNTMLDKMEDIDKQISTWQDKMSDKVDYYTNKFTQLEMLIQQMNSQSSTLSGLMGGY